MLLLQEDERTMKALVIGCEGFIGRYALAAFQHQGWEVAGCDIVYSSRSDTYKYHRVDAFSMDYHEVFSDFQPDVCLNASGSASVAFSFEQPTLDFNSNVVAVQRQLEAIRKVKPDCHYLHLSSAAVYGNPVELPIKEATKGSPMSPYGFHKQVSETLITEYARLFKLRATIFRIFSAYGKELRKQLFWDVYQKLKVNPEYLELSGTGQETRDFIHVRDVCEAICLIAKHEPSGAGILNVANGKAVTIQEVVSIFLSYYSPQTRLQFNGQQRKGDPLYWQAEINKLTSTGYRPSVSIQEGLSEVAQWLLKLEDRNTL